MPRLTPWAASAIGLALLAGCTGPMKSKVADGLAYDCGGTMGKAYIQFGGGGYLPGETALAKGNVWNPAQQARPRLRSTAKLYLEKGAHDLIAEWSEGGLRYRSEVPFAGDNYLIWSVGTGPEAERPERWITPGRPLTSEDARLGLRATADPMDEAAAAGEFYATCRRAGRDPEEDAAAPGHAPEHSAGHSEPQTAPQETPHAP